MGLLANKILYQIYAPLESGRLPHRITVQERVKARNDTGEIESTWQDEFTVWGRYDRLSGVELFAVQQAKGTATSKVTMRYRNNIDIGSKRLKFGELLLDIEAIFFDPLKRELEITVKEAA